MPVYLCNPGEGEMDPWRHGIQVYATPFNIDASTRPSTVLGGGRDLVIAVPNSRGDNKDTSDGNEHTSPTSSSSGHREFVSLATNDARDTATEQSYESSGGTMISGQPIRRVRHAEVVLVDDVCIAYKRFWLRLRWPGSKGGFAGYIAMGLVSDYENSEAFGIGNSSLNFSAMRGSSGSEDRGAADDTDPDDPTREENISTPPSEPFDSETSGELTCVRTGLPFQSSTVLKLLATYDDGVFPRVTLAPFPTEQILCRICREGLHDDADAEQPNAATEDADNTNRDVSLNDGEHADDGEDDNEDSGVKPSEPFTTGPVVPHPAYSSNSDALQNPILAPCECSGSMAFVHYLCVEQWRCRSRHPEAHHGLNCETCNTPYKLPPPSERQDAQLEQEDWLDAMPPHVMQALRQPHIWWQLGAAIVRRRWLRPLAPIFMSPIVALYCRARRLLKKRGVARRRWACSLCRRRARWKCVRCLRSYYCSRQCQNVSWHIIHKHVCYKPIRFWSSVVVYGGLSLFLFPGILRDPLMYDLGAFLIPLSFIIMGVLGGGIATLLKRTAAIDLRGRLLELAVVLWTIWLCVISWGLVKGFFGDSSACYGTLGSYNVTSEDLSKSYSILGVFRQLILQPAEKIYLTWDRVIYSSFWLRILFCTGQGPDKDTCFEHLPHSNAGFFLQENGGEKCASDLALAISLYLLAGVTFAGSSLLKHHDRQRRRQGRRGARGEPRPHQD